MGKATNSIARRGQGGIPPCGVQRQRLWWGLGQRPNRFAGDQFKGNSQQRRRQRSVPASNFARPQTRPKLLYPQLAYCRARWARPTSMGEGFLSMLVFFVAGISPLRRRQGGFPIAPLTPSAPPRLGLSATRFVRSKRFPCQSAFLPDYKTPAAIGQIVRICCRGCAMLLENALTPARTASCTARRRSRPFAAAPRACRIR